jgi:hypothetical protein
LEIIVFDTFTQARTIDDKSIVDALIIFGRTKILAGHAPLDGLIQLLLAFVFAWEICLPLRDDNKKNRCKDDASENGFHCYPLVTFSARTLRTP